MRIPQGPLNEAETAELAELLEHVGGRTLAFARGVLSAVATSPTVLDPTEWLPHLLTQEPPDKASLDRMFGLLVRESQACAECLKLSVPAVPRADASDEVVEFCKGYVRLMQGISKWTRDSKAFEISVPLAVLAGYVGPEALHGFDPSAADDPEAWRARRSASLPDDIATLYAYWAEAREQPASVVPVIAPVAAARVGRNDPCPCGSGKKYKKCCAS